MESTLVFVLKLKLAPVAIKLVAILSNQLSSTKLPNDKGCPSTDCNLRRGPHCSGLPKLT